MKKKIKKQIEVEVNYCNICGKEVEYKGYEKWLKRVEMVRGLFKTDNFDAHPTCINTIIRTAFKEYI